MTRLLEFFFDCSSPWTYLAFEAIQPILEQTGSELAVEWKPILVGGVFNAVNPSVYANRENPVAAKANYYQKDLNDWAEYVGVSIGMPDVFPVNSVKAMRGALVALEEGCLIDYARAVFRRYWGDLKDISQDEELMNIAASVGLNDEDFIARIEQTRYKNRLRSNTDELIQRGGFGSPTLFLDREDMYFGNDRLPLLQRKLEQVGQ